jgi:hypothetical protein
VWEADGTFVELRAGEQQVIPPATPHRVELRGHVRFTVEFFTASRA